MKIIPTAWTWALVSSGVLLFLVGVFLLSPPAALVVAGAACTAVGVGMADAKAGQ